MIDGHPIDVPRGHQHSAAVFAQQRSCIPSYPPAVRSLKARREQVVTTPQNIAEFWNVCTRPTTARGGLGLSLEATERRLRLLERHFRVLADSPAIYEKWKALLLACKVSGVSVHDARLVAAMIVHSVTTILTFNVEDFRRYPGIRAVTPEDINREL